MKRMVVSVTLALLLANEMTLETFRSNSHDAQAGMVVGVMAVTATLGIVCAKPSTVGEYVAADRKSTRLNSSHIQKSRMPSSA